MYKKRKKHRNARICTTPQGPTPPAARCRIRTPVRPPPVGEGLAPPAVSHPCYGYAPVGDGVLDIPPIRTQTYGLTPVGADAPGGPFVRHSTMSAGGRGRPPLRRKRTASHHPVGEGLAPSRSLSSAASPEPRRINISSCWKTVNIQKHSENIKYQQND